MSAQPSPAVPPLPHPPRRVGAGPVVMTVVGALTLALALVAGVLAARQALVVLPVGVIDMDGSPGSDVLAHVEAPGELEVDLTSGTSYSLVLAHRSHQGGEVTAQLLRDDVVVLGPDGEELRVRAAAVDMETTMGGVHAATVGGFTAQESGRHTVVVPEPTEDGEVRLLLTEETPFGEFFAGLGGLMAAAVTAVILGMLGLGLLVGGIIWWVMARRPARVAPAPGTRR